MSPQQFAYERLHITPWSKLDEIFDAVGRGERKVLVRSCNGAGKTTALAALCNWYLAEFPDSIVLTTASSWGQVSRSLWGEIRKQAREASLYDGAAISQTQIKLDDKHYAIGISPERPENAQGFHAPRVFIAVDEATGVSSEIMDALMGNLTGEQAQIVMICNPIDMQSFAYDAEASGDWHVIKISAFDHPNVVSGTEDIKGAVTRRWIEDRLRAWSYEIRNEEFGMRSGGNPIPNSIYVKWLNKYYYRTPIAVSRILGEWADLQSEGFISMELIRQCVIRNVELGMRNENVSSIPNSSFLIPHSSEIKVLGVDIARSGPDSTVFAYFEGNRQLPFETFQHQDTMRTADLIKARYDAGWQLVALDDTGIGGGVTDRLRQLKVPVHAINFAQRPKGFMRERTIELANARAELYFCLEEEIRTGAIELVDDIEFHRELSAIRLAVSEHTPALRMEDKDATRARLGKSPDKADAAALARYALRLPPPVLRENRVFFF